MLKAACVVLAASLTFPLLVTWASPPGPAEPVGEEPPDVVTQRLRLPLSVAGGPVTIDLPDGFESLPPEEQRALFKEYMLQHYMLVPERPTGMCLAAEGAGPGDSICDFGARVSQAKPCLAAGDCPAYEAWEEVMGTPGVHPAPRSMARAAYRPPARIEPPEQD